MGLQGQNGGGNTIYLKIAGNAIWQTTNVDKDHELYVEEDWEAGTNSGTRKGYKIGAVTGRVESVYFKESKFGEMMNVYMDVEFDGKQQKYCLGFPLQGTWGKHRVAKRAMIALMFLDTNRDVTFHVSKSVSSDGFESTNFWVSQDGKNLVLNPDQDLDKFDETKQVAIPENVLEWLENVRTVSYEEMKDMADKKKTRVREDELDDLRAVMESFVLENINKNAESKQKTEKKSDEPKEEPKDEEQPTAPAKGMGKAKDEPKQETARERLARLKAEREAKG